MVKRRGIWIVVVLLVVVIAVVIAKKKSAESQSSSVKGPPVATVPQTLEFLPGDVVTVTSAEVQKRLTLSGALRAVNQAAVKAKLAGDVREVLVREGEAVQLGQVLVKMDTADYEARLAQARGSLAAAQGQLDIARQSRDNNKSLLDKNFISKNAYDNSSNQLAIAAANVASANGVLEVAQKALADTVIRAPIAGLISTRNVQPGEKISPDNRLFDMVDLRVLEMEAPVPTQDIARIKIGQQVQINIEGVTGAVSGQVSRINPATTAGSRSIMAYIQVVNQDGVLRAGMFAEAQLVIEKKSAVLNIPLTAVRYDDGKAFVYTIEKQLLQKNAVTLGLQGDSNGVAVVEILSGVTKDSKVIKTNLGNLRAGMPVKLVPSNQPADKA
ncbi:MAG: efflux RND transporter periplasmic adaptor subunit [Undibacterium sp.]|nr:efflux RND transporter periplasmic adaptor subunit [Undibacterium sp.]